MTISSEPFIMDSKNMHLSPTNDIDQTEVLRKFYENHNDDYDFVSIFTNVKGSNIVHYSPPRNLLNKMKSDSEKERQTIRSAF